MTSKTLQELRAEKGLSSTELSAKAGVGITSIPYLECGKVNFENMTVRNFKKMADALEVDLNEMYEVLKNTKPNHKRGNPNMVTGRPSIYK